MRSRLKPLVATAALSFAALSAHAQENVRWGIPMAFGANLIGLGDTMPWVSEQLKKVSGGTINLQVFEPGKLVPALGIFDAVASGKVEAGYSFMGYEVGKVWGSRVLSHRLLDKRRHQLERAQDFLRRRGGSAVFLGRWTAFFRAVMPALAGVSRMPYRRFLIWNAAGGIVWGVVVVVVGYLAGLSYDRAAAWLGGGATAVVAVIVIGALIVWHVRRRQRERALEHEPAGA